jgi:hypothetical protein
MHSQERRQQVGMNFCQSRQSLLGGTSSSGARDWQYFAESESGRTYRLSQPGPSMIARQLDGGTTRSSPPSGWMDLRIYRLDLLRVEVRLFSGILQC